MLYKIRRLIILFLCFSISNITQGQSRKSIEKTITSQFISGQLNYLASDSMLGRKTPSRELNHAAEYIAEKFKLYGLEPIHGSYFQNIPLVRYKLGEENSFVLQKDTVSYIMELKQDFVPFEFTATRKTKGELAFAGYGITANEYQYDDYKDIDVTGKIVIVFDHEPGELDTSSVFDGVQLSEYGKTKYKMKNAMDHGAASLIILTDPLNHILLKPIGYPWPSLSKLIPNDILPIQLKKENDSLQIPVVHAGKSLIKIVFQNKDSLTKIQNQIDKTLKPNSFLLDIKAELTTSLEEEKINAQNVVGLVQGIDPKLSDEVVIVGAHYDHVGYKRNSSSNADSVFNGADDNASGTSALLGVAKGFSSVSEPPKRSVLFIAFAAEEIGLYGSKAYINTPLVPLDKTVAMLNLDMIGRNHADSLNLHEAVENPKLSKIVHMENKKYKTKFKLNDLGHSGGSDHAPFISAAIPAIFFFSGLHPDYHTVRDNPKLIDFNKAARVSQLCFGTTWYIANDNTYY